MTAVSPVQRRLADPLDLFQSVEAAYRDYGTQCYRLALRIVRDRALAEDVVQDVFESLCREPGRFSPDRGSLSTWLMTITHHKAVDLLRWRRTRTRLDEPDQPTALLQDLMPTPDIAALVDDERRRVVVALHQLNAADRKLLVLAYFGGYSQREIAGHLDVPLGTVKSRTKRAMDRMRNNLDPAWSDRVAD